MNVETYKLTIRGSVQGVGFRPYIYQVANTHGVNGYVTNTSEGVEISLNATSDTLDNFIESIKKNLPPLASIQSISIQKVHNEFYEDFVIKPSSQS